MRICLVLVLTLILFGCSRAEETPSITTEVSEPSPSPPANLVWLEDVEPPVWNERFAVLKVSGSSFVVDWGFSLDNFVMAESSGFPGFGKPILVVGSECQGSAEYSLQTSYGTWIYTVSGTKKAVLNDKGDNLIDKQTGERIIDFAVSDEVLYVYDEGNEVVTIAYLSEGTKVAIKEDNDE